MFRTAPSVPLPLAVPALGDVSKGGAVFRRPGSLSPKIGRAHVRTPVTEKSRMPSSA